MEKQKSFTLIELLVVIAIVGLLASIVMVNVNSARGKAKVAAAMRFSQSLYHALGADAVGVWDFDDCTAKDSSGYGNNGTINGASCVDDTPQKIIGQGQGKYALSFDGNDFIQMGNGSPSLSEISGDKLTIEAWINPYTSAGYIISKNGPFFLYLSGGKLGGEIYPPWTSVTGNISISQNQWHHVVMVYDGAKISLYVDGKFDNSVSKTGDLSGDGCTEIGRYNNGGCGAGVGSYFNGLIDEVRIYGQALAAGQIQQ